jgi:hypothetical protein
MNQKRVSAMVAFLLIALLLTACGGLPTYSKVVASYPDNAEMCGLEVDILEVMPSGAWRLESTAGDLTVKWIAQDDTPRCYGIKITAQVPVTIQEITYEEGTKLTVDKDLNYIAVSSWD